MREMSWVYKINCMYSLLFQLFYYFNKSVSCYDFTFVFVTYGIILTKATFKTTSRKENRTCTIRTTYTRLFPIVDIGTGKDGIFGHFTKSITCVFSSFCITFSRTKVTEHIFTIFHLINCTIFLLAKQQKMLYT